MEPTSANSLATEVQLEIERDMRVYHQPQKDGQSSLQEYVESIVARSPLLGMTVLDENKRKDIAYTAWRAIVRLAVGKKVQSWAHLSIFLTIIQYARGWERISDAGFWAYIANQFGFRYTQQLYNVLTNSVKAACQCYSRLFVVTPNGYNSYYSTVLAHAFAPNKSVFALFDFLVKFYRDNLDNSVYENDPAIGRMVSVLRDRCNGASIEQDEDIRGSVYGIQIGIKALLSNRPGYMRHFLTKTLQKIGSLLDGDELSGKDYVDVLLTQWLIGKMTVSSVPVVSTSKNRRSTPVHKRSTEIVFTYDRIRMEYILNDSNEPALRIPSIRLASRENPVLIISSNGMNVYQRTIGIYGNDYAATSEEEIIPLSDMDISSANLTNLNIELKIGEKTVFTSGNSLNAKALLFKDSKQLTGKTIDEGNFTLFAPNQVNISFQGNVEWQRQSFFAQLFNIYIQGEASIFVDGSMLCCSRPPEGSLRFRLPQTQIEYVVRDNVYPVYSRDEFSVIAVGTVDDGNIVACLQTGNRLSLQRREGDLWQFNSPEKNGGYSLTLSDADSGRIFDEVNFYITDSYSIKFDKPYYLETSEDGYLTLEIGKEHFVVSLMGFGVKAKVRFGNGELQVQIPRVRLLLDGHSIPKEYVWKGDIAPSSTLLVLCPETLAVSINFGDTQISRHSSLGGFAYAIGNSVQAYDGSSAKVSVCLTVSGDLITLFDIVFMMSLTERPRFNLTGNTLIWLNTHSFIGDKSAKLIFVFSPKCGTSTSLTVNQNERILSNDFPKKSELYRYQVFAQTDTAFGSLDSKLIDGKIILGDRASVIFRDVILRIESILLYGENMDIKPVYAENIIYIGTESLDYTDLKGDYAHYKAKLYFLAQTGKRYFTDLNPVDIYLVNEETRRLHISFNGGDGLFIDRSSGYKAELYRHSNPPQKFAKYFDFPDFFIYQ